MTDSTEIQTFNIPSWNIPMLEAKIAKLNKRAEKLGCNPIRVIVHQEKLIPDPRLAEQVQRGLLSIHSCPKIKMVEISIEGEGPKLAGWEFIGTLDHYSLPGHVIVNTVPGHEVPLQFHNSEAICDHCGKIRNRKETFILEDEQGDYKQVGRQCIKDFLGHNPQRIASLLTSLYNLMSELDDEASEFYGYGGYVDPYYELENVLAHSAGVIRTYGWTPRSAAGEGREATASKVSYIMNYPYGGRPKEVAAWKAEVEKVGVNEADFEEGRKAAAWVNEQEADNEYMHNLKAIVEAGKLNGKLLGYACSIVSAYHRAMDRLELAKKENANKLNEWIDAEVKERVEMTVTIVNRRLLDSYFGTVALYRMLDDNGRTVVWFCNGDTDLEKGHTYRAVATIKKKDEFKDWKQTVVNRLRVLEEVNAQPE